MFLCFVEDEFYTREGILNSVDWQALQIDRLESASDGKSGEALLTLRPDILLTDIRLPYHSGLELASSAKEVDADCEIIILSSYSDKEYLFKAISLSAVAYIEKPVDLGKLSTAISQAVERRRRSLSLRERNTEDPSFNTLDGLIDTTDSSLSHATRIILSKLDKDYSNPNLSVESLAEHVHLNPAYLSTVFKKDTGQSLKHLITRVRIQRACFLLRTTNLSISSISVQTGYRASNYFAHTFRQEMGMTPGEYRDLLREKQS